MVCAYLPDVLYYIYDINVIPFERSPTSLSNSTVIEFSIDIRIIAALAKWQVQQGETPRTRAGLVRSILTAAHRSIIDEDVSTAFSSSSDAAEYLGSLSLIQPSRSNKLRLSLSKSIHRETAQEALTILQNMSDNDKKSADEIRDQMLNSMKEE